MGIAVELLQFRLVAARFADRLLLLIERRLQIGDTGTRDLGIVPERSRGLLGSRPQRVVEIAELSTELLDSGMARQICARFEGELRAQIDPLGRDLPNKLVVGDIGNVTEAPLPQHVPNQLSLGLGVGFGRARSRELSRDVGELLTGDRCIVGSEKQARRSSKR